jgi:hypothetical protein
MQSCTYAARLHLEGPNACTDVHNVEPESLKTALKADPVAAHVVLTIPKGHRLDLAVPVKSRAPFLPGNCPR